MPDETAQQRTERQNRLSHAMGVMFLQDKVDKLERDVSKITYPRAMRHSHSAPTAELNPTQPRYHAANPPPKPRAITGPGLHPTTTATPSTSTSATATAATCMRLVDASVLIFSLRSVHNWTRDRATCVIIPLEAINTLDLLKKGDEPINLAARKATRWLEEKIAIAPHDGDQLLTHPAPGIYAQKEAFRASTAQIDKIRAHVVATRLGAADQAQAEARDAFGLEGAPRYLRELLAACVYCQTACASEVEFKVALAYPPAHVQDSMMAAHAVGGDRPSYLVRTDGRATEAWLDAYSVPFEVVPTSKTWTGEKQSSRFRTHAPSSHDADLRSEPSKSTRPDARHSTAMARGRATSSSPPLDNGHFGGIDAQEGPIIARPSSPASSAASFRTSFTASTSSTHDERSQRSAASASSVRIVRHPPDSSAANNDAEHGSKWCRLTSRTLHKTRSGADKMEDYLRRLEAGASAPADRPRTTQHDP
ncbi:uncharacterized protein PAN0_003d1660 [Moesziomyces antarcticus]|uniref:PIN domain-containing protein n=1 Tax=Pseudozyma antarctica TaxID=84753 RepID=A0A5C3FJU5_PSEA2|nr:uncharacterized protein PAN0_003d1660 [Moesziomyces antarcticus]GAK63455.1 conserved hypothetical protein [Moesziomyces antarcticus]SPO44045.1 uncharacterized protein PSANT_01730 [Moesziomyces antarcticus]